MKDDNIFLWVKAVIAAACGAFTAAFGWLGWLVVAWAACMVLDWLSGSAAAASSTAKHSQRTLRRNFVCMVIPPAESICRRRAE